MNVVVVAGGELPTVGLTSLVEIVTGADLLIAADGGIVHCRTFGRWPDLLVGDMDSAPAPVVDEAVQEGVEVLRHPADKDATDLELALGVAVDRGASSLTVLAIFGGRVDHELASIAMLAAQRFGELPLMATDGRRALWIVRRSLSLSLALDTSLSLIPWGGAVSGVHTTGLRWPLANESLPAGSTRGVSNRCVAPRQTIEVGSGTLLVVADQLRN